VVAPSVSISSFRTRREINLEDVDPGSTGGAGRGMAVRTAISTSCSPTPPSGRPPSGDRSRFLVTLVAEC